MKRILSLILAVLMLLSLTACFGEMPPEISLPPTSDSSQQQSTLPPQTDPPETTLPPQTDPPETTLPPQTDPPETTQPPQTEPTRPTLPPQTDPPVTRPPVTEPPVTEPTQPSTTAPTEPPETEPPVTEPEPYLDPDGSYTTKEDVALYIHLYGRLPDNFITKSQAKKLGWKSGSVHRYAPGKCIGGDYFGNREKLLPSGHTYYECDIDTLGSYGGRGSKRIVFSSDGLIYYTDDHYKSFTLLYGDP